MSLLSDMKRTFVTEWDFDYALKNEPTWAVGLFILCVLSWAILAGPFFVAFWIIGAITRWIVKR